MIDPEFGTFSIPELIISRCIKHPHIVRAHKVDRKLGLQKELQKGLQSEQVERLEISYPDKAIIKLEVLLEQDILSNKQKLKIIYEIGTALATLHSKGFCHRNIKINGVIGEYDELYYHPKLIIRATKGSKDRYAADIEDYKVFILEILCPNIEESFRLDKDDLSMIIPFVPKLFKNFVARLSEYKTIFEILAAPEFDQFNQIPIIEYSYFEINSLSINQNDKTYRMGLKEIYNVFKTHLLNRCMDELFAAIDIYNRAYKLVENGMEIRTYYSACILIACKLFEDNYISIDDIRDSIHTLYKTHPKREDILSAELDIIVFVKGMLYSFELSLYNECKNFEEIYAILNFYILDQDRYTSYNTFLPKLKALHQTSVLGKIERKTEEQRYNTCSCVGMTVEQFLKLEENLNDNEDLLYKIEDILE